MGKSFAQRVAEQLKAARQDKGMTQDELDRALGGTGDNKTISLRERGDQEMMLSTVERTALALGHRPVLVLEPIEKKGS